MILVAIVAELLEEYTAAVARAMELLLSRAPPRIFPRRVRFLVLRPEPPLRLAAAVPSLSPAALHRRRRHPLIVQYSTLAAELVSPLIRIVN
uniref:Uncharacterized protein n=1 Tax=Oryza barthii TaxID=65489 RepID=A0A0D3GQT3_9ORYZ